MLLTSIKAGSILSLKEAKGLALQGTFKALSDATRREILELLKNGEKSAGEIADSFDVSFATISHHLAILKNADLIYDKKKGKYIYYELNLSVVEQLMNWLISLSASKEDEE